MLGMLSGVLSNISFRIMTIAEPEDLCLLGPRINQTERRNIKGPAHDVRRHVTDKGHVAGIWELGPLGTFDGIV